MNTARRLAPAFAGTLACCAVALALAGPASGVQPTSVGVRPLSTSQAAILKTSKLKVRVESGVAGRVRVLALVSDGGRRAFRVAQPRVAAIKPGGRGLKLKLTPGGRTLLTNCAPKRLVVKARVRVAGDGSGPVSGTKRAIASAQVAVDTPECGASGAPGGGGGGGGTPNGNVIPPPQPYTGAPIATANSARCDLLDAAVCLQPWPNDYFTAEDPSTDTGRKLNLNLLSMPANQPLGSPLPVKPIDPTESNRSDGFSPGNMIVTKVPGLDDQQAFDNSGLVSIDHPERYDDPGQGVVVINADTGERHPVWAEIDANPTDPADRNLIVRPLRNFDEGGHYVVALRGLRNAANQPIQPADAFRVYRDNLTTDQTAVESRRAHMEDLFETLGQAGIQRSGLYIAWDFTVASERNLSERALKIRDDAFQTLGDDDLADGTIEGASPAFTVTSTDEFTEVEDANIAREVKGTVTVPCFMSPGCTPTGATFNRTGSPDGLPVQNGTTDVAFTCEIPRAAVDAPDAAPSRPSLYGHGLLGSQDEVGGGNVKAMANEHDFTMCAVDWYGFATTNVPNILVILQDVSNFALLGDATQQGFLNFLFMGRAMIHPDGLVTDPAFQGPDGPDAGGDPDPLLDTSRLYYDGNSQGGILGGSLTALSPDFRQAVLGVPGMNYSTLLERSVDFEPYAEGQFTSTVCDQFPAPLDDVCNLAPGDTPLGLYDNYPNELERPLLFSLMQLQWDRAEANGYAAHMTSDPLPNTPTHNVLLHAAFGDHQVANVTAEVEARTIGASVYQPALDPGRHWQASGSNPIFGIPAIPSFPFGGSALVYWDGGPLPAGTATPPNEDVPPRPPDYGVDPHSFPRNDIKARAQKASFLSPGGMLLNFCTAENNVLGVGELPVTGGTATPCYSHGYAGN